MKLNASAMRLAAAIFFATGSAAAQSFAEARAKVFDATVKAVQTWSHARLIGATTAGTILSGENFDVAPGWVLTVPTAGHWSAAGEDLNDKPVMPHEVVPETRADLCTGRDRGVERAMAILAGG
jgi:C-terminal processing protease CtpA/Prc